MRPPASRDAWCAKTTIHVGEHVLIGCGQAPDGKVSEKHLLRFLLLGPEDFKFIGEFGHRTTLCHARYLLCEPRSEPAGASAL
jgi:hypothetical protein